ncbi:uncharacterized protein JCM10292_002744 [Rhodotorula paludigena]|uniref:uncharacterized protein n=1 Tax=Rhodotorula paludigena TaxID=86838 RepID=UPI003180C0CA
MSRAGGEGSSPVDAIERGPIAGEFHDHFYPGPHQYAVKLHTDEASLEMLIKLIHADNPFVDEDYFTGRQDNTSKEQARKDALELAKRLLLGLTALFEVLMHKKLVAPYREWHVQFRTPMVRAALDAAPQIYEDNIRQNWDERAFRDRFQRKSEHDSEASGERAWAWGLMCDCEMDRTARAHFAEVLEPALATLTTMSCVGIHLTFQPSAFHVAGRSAS